MKNATSGTSPQKKTTPLSVHYRPTTAKKRADRKSDRDERWCTRTNAILVPIECRINETLIFEIQCNVRSKQWSFTFEKGKTKSDKLSEAVPSRKKFTKWDLRRRAGLQSRSRSLTSSTVAGLRK